MPVLIRALEQGAEGFTEEERRIVMSGGREGEGEGGGEEEGRGGA